MASNEDTLKALGKLIDTDQLPPRDAVHVAVVPVVAKSPVVPGQAVGIGPVSGEADPRVRPAVGIVDPFLTRSGVAVVQAGQAFWLFLWPGSITSLTHHWTHPAFPAEALPQAAPTQSPPEPGPAAGPWTPEAVALVQEIRETQDYGPKNLQKLAKLLEENGFQDVDLLGELIAADSFGARVELIADIVGPPASEWKAAVQWLKGFAKRLDQGMTYEWLMDHARRYMAGKAHELRDPCGWGFTWENTFDDERAAFRTNYERATGGKTDALEDEEANLFICGCG